MASTVPVPLSQKSQKAFIAYYQALQSTQETTRGERRARLEKVDRDYQREVDRSKVQADAANANHAGDITKLQNIIIPVVMPQVEAAVAHQASVFLTEQPLFGTVSSPEFIDEAMQMETLLDNQAIKGGWSRQLIMFFRDGFKHNFAPIEVTWASKVTYSVETNINENLKDGTPKSVIWNGNKIKRLDPYNTFVDDRVPPSEAHEHGEFAGYTELMSRIKLKTLISELPSKIIGSITPALESGIGTGGVGASDRGYYVPDINPKVTGSGTENGGTNWMTWAGLSTMRNMDIEYKDSYEVTTLNCRVLPSEFELNVPNKNTPQIYKLIIVNHEHIIYCELQTNAHNMLPILVGMPKEDGLSYQTKSMADDAAPFQEVATTYMASIQASRRRAISDRLLYDPSRVLGAHINSVNPSAKIPVRPKAYGKNLNEAVYQFPYREDQAGNSMQQISALLNMSNELVGQNKVSQGQFQKGNKTLAEFESVMANSSGRDQLASIMLEFQVFVPMKEMLKLNILQYQGGTTIYNRDEKKVVEIDPLVLRKAVTEFKVSDGLIPSDQMLNSENFSVAMQVFGSAPSIAAGYNVAPFFSYLMKTQGADITAFEKSPEQIAYENAVGSWQSMVQLAIEKGSSPEESMEVVGPQPKPEEFGYRPSNAEPTPQEAKAEEDRNAISSLIPTE